jgi:hypothetical protein
LTAWTLDDSRVDGWAWEDHAMDDRAKERVAANEAAFREVNEAIERGQWPGEEDSPVGFRCECARLGCDHVIELTVHEYERVRTHPRWFVLVAGHQVPEQETVVESQSGYVVVEKLDAAGAVAEATDPRA